MSDISIPGVTASKYGTDKLIEGLMKAERVPREREDAQLKTYQKQQSAWREINQQSSTLRDSTKSMYSFDNPFTEKITESTNERAITAVAKRDARDQSFKVSVSQIAEADSFLSSEVKKDGKVPKGDYEFAVGEKKVSFSWKGGSYREFIDALNRRSGDIIRGSIVQVTADTQSLLIESLKTGAKERLTFGGDALQFALDTGLIRKNDASAVSPSVTAVTATPVSNKTVEFTPTARARDGLVLEYDLTVTDSGTDEAEAAQPSGPDLGNAGSISYQGITIANEASEAGLTEAAAQIPQAPVIDQSVLSVRTTKGIAIPLPSIPETAGKTAVSVPLSEYGDVNALLVQNRNTARTVTVENIRIRDPKAAGEYVPVNPVSVAQDANLKYEGIPITRPTNAIDDLVPGVTITLNEPTEKTETLTVKPDSETAKQAIITFIANYNRVMADINILTQNKPEIITEIQYFTDDEKKAAKENLGMMLGDSTLNGVKNTLQRVMSNSYTPGDGKKFTMLSQIGISTKSAAGGSLDSTRLRGYLEIDEKKLDEALKNSMPDVKSLFGYDTDGDLIIDNGVAQALDKNLGPYVQTGGIYANRISGLGTRIETSTKKIALLDKQLETKQQELKEKYGKMEGTLNSLQSQSNSISNFSKQNSN
jgi:flagellar hook-associated protein 2